MQNDGGKMKFQKPITEIIKMRSSCRTYDSREVEDETLQKLNDYIEEINSEAKGRARFIIINQNSKYNGSAQSLGTYGVISGANSFIVGIINKNNQDACSFGYLFEKIILYATDLNLQTCWLGGTFKRDDFVRLANLQDNEHIPIVSPVGYKKGKARILESAMRKLAGSDNRKQWDELFFDGDISKPLDKNHDGSYDEALEMVRLGPSASNKQPWRIVKNNDMYHFYLCRTKGYGLADYDMQKNDIGIAMCHFELTAKESGFMGSWEELKNIDSPDGWEYVITWTNYM